MRDSCQNRAVLRRLVDVVVAFAVAFAAGPLNRSADAQFVFPPDVSISKFLTLTRPYLYQGDTATYAFAAFNSASDTASSVVVTETVPNNTTFNAAASLPTTWSCADNSVAGTVCSRTVGDIGAFASVTGTFAVNVLAPAGNLTATITNTIVATPTAGALADSNPNNNQYALESTLVPWRLQTSQAAFISLDNNNNGTLDVGDEVSVTVMVTNTGVGPISGMSVRMRVNDNGKGQYISGTPTTTRGNITQLLGDSREFYADHIALQPNQSVQVRYKAQMLLAGYYQPYQLSFNADVMLPEFEPFTFGPIIDSPPNATISVTTKPDLYFASTIVSQGPADASGAKPVSINPIPRNAGGAPASGVVLTMTLPIGAEIVVSETTAGWNCVAQNCSFSIGALGAEQDYQNLRVTLRPTALFPNDQISITVPLRLSEDGTHGAEIDLTNNSVPVDAPFGAPATITATKSGRLTQDANGDSKLAIGDEIEYTINVTNTGQRVGRFVHVDDRLINPGFVDASTLHAIPESITSTRGVTTLSSVSLVDTVGVDVDTLAAGQSFQVRFRAVVATLAPIEFFNTYYQNWVTVTDGLGASIRSNTTNHRIYASRDVDLTLSSNPSPAQVVTYTQPISFTLRINGAGIDTLGPVTIELANSRSASCLALNAASVSTTRGVIDTSLADSLKLTLNTLAPTDVVTLAFRSNVLSATEQTCASTLLYFNASYDGGLQRQSNQVAHVVGVPTATPTPTVVPSPTPTTNPFRPRLYLPLARR